MRPVSHQWMEEIFMHKNDDFPSLISIMNGVRLITGRPCNLLSPKGIDDSHITPLYATKVTVCLTSLPRKRKIGCVQKTRLTERKSIGKFRKFLSNKRIHLILSIKKR